MVVVGEGGGAEGHSGQIFSSGTTSFPVPVRLYGVVDGLAGPGISYLCISFEYEYS